MSSRQHRLFLVDHHPIVRMGLAALIADHPRLELCGETRSGREALHLIGSARPSLVIADIALPDMNGLELVKELQVLHPQLPILIFSAHDEMLYAERVIKAGGRGYLPKHADFETIEHAIMHTAAGNVFLSQTMANQLLRSIAINGHRPENPKLESLSDRELEVYELIGRGKSTHEIADQLCICVRTVEAHRTHIREKLKLANAADVIRNAVLWVESDIAQQGH